jgi:NitT/TauT family transport system ATP-binding protein
MSSAIVLDHVSKKFSSYGREVTAVDGLSMAVELGEYVCIVGRSGGGKSTTVNLILGLLAPTKGTVRVFGHDPVRGGDILRGRVACVFQSDRLMPWRTALENVRLPLEIIGREEARLAISPAEWLSRFKLDGFEDAYPHELSGGMRQRVALARAMACEPDIVLADESFASLDAVTGETLRKEFRSVVKETGKTVIHITHSIDEATSLADRILVFGRPGRVWAEHVPVREGSGHRLSDIEMKHEITAVMASLDA